MKFPTTNDIAIVRGDQISARQCYLNSLRKAKPRDVIIILMDIDMNDIFEKGQTLEWEDIDMLDASKQKTIYEVIRAPKEVRATKK